MKTIALALAFLLVPTAARAGNGADFAADARLFYRIVACAGEDPIDAKLEKVVAAGGKIHVEEQEVPGMGSFILFTDPEGRMMGLWKSAHHHSG